MPKNANTFEKVEKAESFSDKLKAYWYASLIFLWVLFRNTIFIVAISGIIFLNLKCVFPLFDKWQTGGWSPVLSFTFFELIIIIAIGMILRIKWVVVLFATVTPHLLEKYAGIEKPKNKS